MTELRGVHVYSEIGRLKRVVVHCPGMELNNLTPLNMKGLLFDDIPDCVSAKKEHDAFTDVLRESGAEVIYVTDLIADILACPDIRAEMLERFLTEARIFQHSGPRLLDHLLSVNDPMELVHMLIAGMRCEDYQFNDLKIDLFDRKKTLFYDPMPNFYYMRDPFSTIGCGVSINCMWTETRQRESLLLHYVAKHHPIFREVHQYYSRNENATIEGGDILVLSKEVVAIGVSQRTETSAVKAIARNILGAQDSFQHILAFFIPERRAFMHLDTVFTMVDKEIFTIHPEIEGPLEIFDITLNKDGELDAKNIGGHLESILKKYLRLTEVNLIRCGGESRIDAQREQWNDGANTLAIAPGEVVVYDRNPVTNRLLREAGVKVHEIASSELSRGRGGPRCMTQPLWREDID